MVSVQLAMQQFQKLDTTNQRSILLVAALADGPSISVDPKD